MAKEECHGQAVLICYKSNSLYLMNLWLYN